MIDRRAYWISGALTLCMLAAALWRVSLLADWTRLPRYGEGGVAMPPVSSWTLFVSPGVVIFMAVLLAMRGWLSTASREERQPWKKWGSLFLVAYSVIVALMQIFVIMRSLGIATSLSPVQISRGALVLLALLMIVKTNQVPKLPWLASRIGILNLDSETGARLLRIRGRMGVGMGFVIALSALLTPVTLLRPVMLSIAAVAMVAGLFVRFQVKRGQPG